MGAADTRVIIEQLADGRFHSGEALARLLGVSRTAVWKHLQGIGERFQLEVHAVRGRGYRLARPVELLSVPAIEAGVAPPQRSTLAAVEVFDSLPSTSRFLAERIDKWGAQGRICLAEQQTAGRGRRGRHWVSPFGANLYLSLYWQFDLAMADLNGLSLAAGIAVVRALERLGLAGGCLKWPNDVHLGGRKLGGLLVEVFGPTSGPVSAVVGVGVNYDMPETAGHEIDQEWTDVRRCLGDAQVSRNRLAGLVVDELVKMVILFQREGWPAFQAIWNEYDAYVGRVVEIQTGQGRERGVYAGVDADGGLLLRQEGRTSVFHAGDVSLRVAHAPATAGRRRT